jgi:hypothetical protein
MEQLTKLETKITELLKPVPNLPLSARRWLGRNAWYFVVITLVIAAISALFLTIAIANLSAAIATINIDSSFLVSAHYDNTLLFREIFQLVLLAITIIVSAIAIKPLRSMRYRGWFLIYLLLIYSAVSIVLGAIISFNPFSFLFDIISGAVELAVATYFVFEIRSQFDAPTHKHVRRATVVKK